MSAVDWVDVHQRAADDHDSEALSWLDDGDDLANLAAHVYGQWAFDERSRIAAEVLNEWAQHNYGRAAFHREQAEWHRANAANELGHQGAES